MENEENEEWRNVQVWVVVMAVEGKRGKIKLLRYEKFREKALTSYLR
jgi:hypothetical protein